MEVETEIGATLKKVVKVGTCKCGRDKLLPESMADKLPEPPLCGGCEDKYRRDLHSTYMDGVRDNWQQEKQQHIQEMSDSGKRLQAKDIQDFVTVLYKERTGYPAGPEMTAQFVSILGTVCAVKVKANFKYWIFKSSEKPTLKRFLETMGVDYYKNRG